MNVSVVKKIAKSYLYVHSMDILQFGRIILCVTDASGPGLTQKTLHLTGLKIKTEYRLNNGEKKVTKKRNY